METNFISNLSDPIKKRHLSASRRIKASYTVEASFLMPLFSIIMTALLLIFRIYQLQWGVETSIWECARHLALSGDTTEEDGVIGTATAIAVSEGLIVKNDVPASYALGGNLGLLFTGTEVSDRDIDITVSYAVPLPIGGRLFNRFGRNLVNEGKARRWVGYDPHEDEESDSDYVYVTETGTVYHDSINCTYLSPSIHSSRVSALGIIRSKDGRIYHACKLCGGGTGLCYYTDYGEVYHSSLTCSGLKRTIKRMKRSEAVEKYPPCSKCGGSHED